MYFYRRHGVRTIWTYVRGKRSFWADSFATANWSTPCKLSCVPQVGRTIYSRRPCVRNLKRQLGACLHNTGIAARTGTTWHPPWLVVRRTKACRNECGFRRNQQVGQSKSRKGLAQCGTEPLRHVVAAPPARWHFPSTRLFVTLSTPHHIVWYRVRSSTL
jgi:hypothetical protein